MLELNGPERRSLRAGVALLVAGTAVRLGCAPGVEEYAWRVDPPAVTETAGPPAAAPSSLEELARRVGEETRKEARAARPLAPGERLDPNRAPPEELERLPGIGPVLARRIVARRERDGPFRRPSDLLAVSGIGPRTLERIRPHLDLR